MPGMLNAAFSLLHYCTNDQHFLTSLPTSCIHLFKSTSPSLHKKKLYEIFVRLVFIHTVLSQENIRIGLRLMLHIVITCKGIHIYSKCNTRCIRNICITVCFLGKAALIYQILWCITFMLHGLVYQCCQECQERDTSYLFISDSNSSWRNFGFLCPYV